MKAAPFFVSATALAVAACTTTPAAVAPRPEATVALRPYYASLEKRLPVAPPGIALDPVRTVTRIAFGSCDNQERHQTVWPVIAATRPDLFLMIGDNVYGDTRATGAADIPTLTAAYSRLVESEEFRAFRARIPMAAIWDDHDFGHNDGGGSFAFKEYAERVFETFWSSPAHVRERSGVYDSIILGPDGKRVQIILLDTRFFRSDLKSLPYQDPPPALGWYMASDDSKATILGAAQWAWLDAELAKPADLRLVISSIQIETDAHGYEKWGNFPQELARLHTLLATRGIDNAILLSGDRHQGAIYRASVPGLDRPLWEITSSSLNFSFARPGESRSEPDPIRTDGMFPQENFGLVEIDWEKRTAMLKLRNNDGTPIAERAVPF